MKKNVDEENLNIDINNKKKEKKKKLKFRYYILLFISIFILMFSIKPIIFRLFGTHNDNNQSLYAYIADEPYVSIDFGNSKSSYAYKLSKNNDTIHGQKKSVPSIVILNKDNLNGKNFGQKSISSMSNYNEDEISKIIYMNNLKMLINNITKEDNDINKEQYLIASKAIVEYIRLFKDEIIKEINTYNYTYDKEEINWIITAPRIWDDYTKINLINFAKEAGMDKVQLALESEIAALSIFNATIVDEKLKKKGKIFLLIDLGDYTIDITLNEIVNNNDLKVLSMPMGDSLGSMNINKDLMEIIENILGKESINKVKELKFDDYLLTLKGLEDLKKTYKKNSKEYYDVYAKFDRETNFIDKIKDSFNYIYNLLTGKKYIYLYTYDNCTIKFDGNTISFPDKLIEKIIQKRVYEIINYIKSKLNDIKKFDYIILTGGYSNNGILIEEFRKNFNNNVYILSNQEYSVLEGFINYFDNKKKIYSKVSYNTYGIGKDDKIEILKKKGDIIEYNFVIKKSIKIIPNKDDYFCIDFYKSINDAITNDDYFGTLKIDLTEYHNIKNDKIFLNLIIHLNTHLQIDVHDSKNYKKIKSSFVKNKCNNYQNIF